MFFFYGNKETEYLQARDARLSEVIARLGHVERQVDADLFHAVVHSIVGQQISMKAQQTVWLRLQDLLGGISAQSIAGTEVAALQSVGMTFRKAQYIRDFSCRVLDGSFDLDSVSRLPDEQAIMALCSLKGIGRWTAEMILLFCLQRPDILSFDDQGIQRGMRMVYRHRKIGRELFEKYRRRLSPYGSVASLYFWEVSGGAIPELTDPAAKVKK